MNIISLTSLPVLSANEKGRGMVVRRFVVILKGEAVVLSVRMMKGRRKGRRRVVVAYVFMTRLKGGALTVKKTVREGEVYVSI